MERIECLPISDGFCTFTVIEKACNILSQNHGEQNTKYNSSGVEGLNNHDRRHDLYEEEF